MLTVVQIIYSFRPLPPLVGKLAHGTRSNKLQASFLDQVSSQLVAVGGADYASEIENAVGEEIYGPIFKAGVFLFVSGVVAAFGVAFIVSKSDSWNDLQDEFDVGKQKQLISSDAEIDIAAASQNAASSEPVVTENAKDTGRGQRNEDGIDIDSLDL